MQMARSIAQITELEVFQRRTELTGEALIIAFEKQHPREEILFHNPPGDPEITAWNKRFVGGTSDRANALLWQYFWAHQGCFR